MPEIYEQRECGLIVPKAKPAPPERKYAPLELPTVEQRRVAKDALSMLWDAMELSSPPGIVLPGRSQEAYDAHYQAYRYVGEMLLGKDCPEKEVLT